MKRWLRGGFFAVALVFFAGTFVNASWLAPTPVGNPALIAHAAADPEIGSCETAPGAARYPVLPDNSLRAVTDVRQYGAAMIAVRIATDGSVAPARCRDSYGANPTLSQIAQVAKPKSLLFVFSADDPAAADRLAEGLEAIGRDPVASRDAFYAVNETGPVARMREIFPRAWVFSAESAARCLADYRAQAWSGLTPSSCQNGTMMIPVDDQSRLWGWPDRLLARIKDAGGHVVMVAPGAVDGDPKGLDLPEQLGEIPASFNGYIWTDDLWNLGPALFPRVDNRSRMEQDAGEAAVNARRAARQ